MQLVRGKSVDTMTTLEELHRQSRFQLAKLLRCTEEMLACAESGDWESVEEMEYARKEELAACFIESSNENSLVIVEAIAALIHLNTKILALVKDAKSEIVLERGQIETNKTALNHYQVSQNMTE